VNVGDIYWVELPGGAGRAQAGRRPAIVAQSSSASANLPTALVVPLTTQLDALRFVGTFLVEPHADNGLRRPSVALVFQLTAVDRRIFGARLGRIDERGLEQMWATFDFIAGRRENP
jgi:mRNA-degrading endonuclease toxin of MazEF toxin-antitoxin module